MNGCKCRKSYCKNRTCRCKKADKQCTEDCSCESSLCENKNVQLFEEDAKAQALDWEEINSLLRSEQAILRKCEELHLEPSILKEYFDMKKAKLNEIDNYLLSQMEGLSLTKDTLSGNEWEEFKKKLVSCDLCERSFIPDRIEKHKSVCKRMTFCVKKHTD